VKVIIEQGNLIKIMVDEKVDALIKTLRERESTELHSLSKTNTDCKQLLGEATRQQHHFQDMIKQCDEVSLFHTMMKTTLESKYFDISVCTLLFESLISTK
jgi:hypothetical protein